jgi:dsDNA-specific endonuclease/ATPase MutS2
MKIGDKVSVVDEDLAGVVTSVKGKIVTFKDEFGFTHQFSVDHLVIKNADFYEGITTITKEEKIKVVSKKHNSKHLVLDLHFENLVNNPHEYESFERLFIQKEKILQTIDFCKKNNLKKLEIIHGIGDGTLQRMVLDLLESQVGLDFYHMAVLKNQSGSVFVEFQ